MKIFGAHQHAIRTFFGAMIVCQECHLRKFVSTQRVVRFKFTLFIALNLRINVIFFFFFFFVFLMRCKSPCVEYYHGITK